MEQPDSFVIRRLRSADVPMMREMLRMFGEAFGEVQTYTGDQPSAAYLEQLLAGDSFFAFAAVKDGGLAAWRLTS